jgi:vacuolar protein sorting-associated protein 45
MNAIATTKAYVERIVTGNGRCRGMKVLLLDAFTTQIVSCVYSQSQILAKEVYLVSRIDDMQNPNLDRASSISHDLNLTEQKTSHLKAVIFLRPTEINVGLLLKELTRPRFSEYHIFFSGILTSGLLRLIAENDEHEVVKQVQEFFADFLPINEDLISLNCRNTIAMTVSAGTAWARDYAHLYERNRQGLEAMLLALKRQPTMIRYQASSAFAQQMARDVHERIVSDQIFHFRSSGRKGCLLLVLDRVDDPVTPLLSQWTYQAMVHELLGLNNNRVILRGAPNVSKELEEVVLSCHQDDFFRANRLSNFGELGEAIQKLLKDYQQKTQSHDASNLNSIEAMQQFMEKFPELRSQSHNVSKHVAIMGELARLVEICSLMDVSQFEQELACSDDHSIQYKELLDKLGSIHIKIPDKLRLGLLYALRYENSGNLNRIKVEMKRGGVPDHMVDLIDTILRYSGNSSRGPGLYGVGPKDLMSKMTKSFMTNVQGVSNVYSQHVPVLIDTFHAIAKGKLKQESHPYIIGRSSGDDIPSEVIVFIAGGVTYEEAAKISEFNKSNAGRMQVLVGGSTVHNSTSFLDELKALP